MVDYSIFDSILDAAFVIDSDCKVLYCNDAAATFCQSSVRRLTGKAILSDLVTLEAPEVFPFNENSPGRLSPSSFIETGFHLPKADHKGKLQLAIRPIKDNEWLFYVRDVSLEEALHSKYRSELSQKEGYIAELEEARRKLEDYSHNLEKIVEARTAELSALNLNLNAILNSLGQGFFIFDRSGICGNVFTRSCETILGTKPVGLNAWDVLAVPQSGQPQFLKWMEACFLEPLPFDDLKPLGPNLFPNSDGRHVTLEYYPIRAADQKIQSIVVVATDRSAEYKAQIALEEERQYASMVVKYIRNKDQFLQFLNSVKVSVQRLNELVATPLDNARVNESFRILHTLEGESGTFSMNEMRLQTREVQAWLEPFKQSKTALDAKQTDEFRNFIVKFERDYQSFLEKNKDVIRMPKSASQRAVEVELQVLKDLFVGLKKFNVPEDFIAPFESQVFKETIESRLSYYDGLIQNIAAKLGKKMAPLKILNSEYKVRPEYYQKLFSAFVHAFRNAVDHGIEMPEEREWTGKPAEGQISIELVESGSNIQILLKDDGKGIDPAVIRKKLQTNFPDQDFTNQSDEEIIQHVFKPAFSSREEVGEFSGRGVGLDALREEVVRMSGQIRVLSTVGQGTTIEIIVPAENQGYALARSA